MVFLSFCSEKPMQPSEYKVCVFGRRSFRLKVTVNYSEKGLISDLVAQKLYTVHRRGMLGPSVRFITEKCRCELCELAKVAVLKQLVKIHHCG